MDLINKLQSYKPLDQHEDLKEFVNLVRQVIQIKDPQYIPTLLSFFSDTSEFPDVMQFLLTELEEYPPEKYIPKLLKFFPDMLKEAPEWIVTIVIRMVNDKNCFNILKKNIQIAQEDKMKELLDLIAKESPDHAALCAELKQELLNKSKKM